MKHASGPQFIYVRDDLAVGEPTPWHTHTQPHNSFVVSGRALIELGGEAFEVSSTDAVFWRLVPAGVPHRVTKLEEGTRIACVFSHPDGRFDHSMDAYG